MDKTLVLYYSLEGSTEKIAKYLAEELNLDIERVRPKKEIKSKGFFKYVIGGYQATAKRKPKLNSLTHNLDDYSTIIIGTPVWAGGISSPIYSLLKANNIKNKKIGMFYTCEGGNKKTDDIIKTIVNESNSLISICSLKSVSKDLENQQTKVLDWAKNF
jgi:flavodoxin